MKEKLDRAISLMEQVEFLREQVSSALGLRERLSGRELIISVVGQFKRGKSSLINALLGTELLPVGIVPLTAAVTEIREGDNFQALVNFTDGSEREITRSELPDYISELKNPHNQKNVASVKLWTARTPFDRCTTLVDTPGVGSVHQHNTQTSYSYIEKSDAVLFLLSVDSPVSEVERDFLLRARKYAARLYFAVNKTDTISEKNLREFLFYCKAVLSEVIGTDVTLYPISAKTGEGITVLAKKLGDDLRASQHDLLETSILIKLETIIVQAKAKLNLFLEAATIPADELGVKLAEIQQKQLRLTAFSDEVQVLTKRQTERLVERIRRQLDTTTKGFKSDVAGKGKRLSQKLMALPSRQFERELVAGLNQIVRDQLIVLNTEGLELLEQGYAAIVKELNEKAEEIAQFVSDMVKDQFGLDYVISPKQLPVSKHSDFRIKVGQSKGFLLQTGVLTHLLPRAKANSQIYGRAMKQMSWDLDRNKNNMIYNYAYKMQESLRNLCGEFIADISQMGSELDDLLSHVKRSHGIENEELRKLKEEFMNVIEQLGD